MQNFCDSSLAFPTSPSLYPSLSLPLSLFFLSLSLSHTYFYFSQLLHTLIQYALLEILRCLSSSWGFSHAPKSLQHFCVHTTFVRLEYFYLTRIYCEATTSTSFTIYLCTAPPFLLSHTLFTHTLRVSSA